MSCFLCHGMSVGLVRVALGDIEVAICWDCLSGPNFWRELGGIVVWRAPAEPVGLNQGEAPGGIMVRLR